MSIMNLRSAYGAQISTWKNSQDTTKANDYIMRSLRCYMERETWGLLLELRQQANDDCCSGPSKDCLLKREAAS